MESKDFKVEDPFLYLEGQKIHVGGKEEVPPSGVVLRPGRQKQNHHAQSATTTQ